MSYLREGQSVRLQSWIKWMEGDHAPETLYNLLAEDAVFYSPVVFTGQKGRDLVMAYLSGAGTVLGDGFVYRNMWENDNSVVLEFETEVDGLYVNGIDIITWNDAGKISDFKVMLRPQKALEATKAQMMKALEALKPAE